MAPAGNFGQQKLLGGIYLRIPPISPTRAAFSEMGGQLTQSGTEMTSALGLRRVSRNGRRLSTTRHASRPRGKLAEWQNENVSKQKYRCGKHLRATPILPTPTRWLAKWQNGMG